LLKPADILTHFNNVKVDQQGKARHAGRRAIFGPAGDLPRRWSLLLFEDSLYIQDRGKGFRHI
jgi:hypothetical protein